MEMDGDSEKDKATLDALLSSLLTDLLQLSGDVGAMAVRTPRHEVELVVLRLLSVLMSRARSSNKSTSEVLLRALL
jgi:E3 ubiquitin-protein ligase UBR4